MDAIKDNFHHKTMRVLWSSSWMYVFIWGCAEYGRMVSPKLSRTVLLTAFVQGCITLFAPSCLFFRLWYEAFIWTLSFLKEIKSQSVALNTQQKSSGTRPVAVICQRLDFVQVRLGWIRVMWKGLCVLRWGLAIFTALSVVCAFLKSFCWWAVSWC